MKIDKSIALNLTFNSHTPQTDSGENEVNLAKIDDLSSKSFSFLKDNYSKNNLFLKNKAIEAESKAVESESEAKGVQEKTIKDEIVFVEAAETSELVGTEKEQDEYIANLQNKEPYEEAVRIVKSSN